jgi:hypothetical protein
MTKLEAWTKAALERQQALGINLPVVTVTVEALVEAPNLDTCEIVATVRDPDASA